MHENIILQGRKHVLWSFPFHMTAYFLDFCWAFICISSSWSVALWTLKSCTFSISPASWLHSLIIAGINHSLIKGTEWEAAGLVSGNENLYSTMRFIFSYRKEVPVNTKKDIEFYHISLLFISPFLKCSFLLIYKLSDTVSPKVQNWGQVELFFMENVFNVCSAALPLWYLLVYSLVLKETRGMSAFAKENFWFVRKQILCNQRCLGRLMQGQTHIVFHPLTLFFKRDHSNKSSSAFP